MRGMENFGLGTKSSALAATLVVVAVLIATVVSVPGSSGAGKYTTLYRFKGRADGSSPIAGLIFDSAGNLYGSTQNGGSHSVGVVFQLTPNGDGRWKESVLHSFNDDGKDGLFPAASLTFDTTESLYGTTEYGGVYGRGTVFKLTPNGKGSSTEIVIHSFNSDHKDGNYPVAGLIFDRAGNLYGTTPKGGDDSGDGYGAVFKLTPNVDGSWTESVLYSFTSNSNGGWYPAAGLTLDSTGSLYGTTPTGGAYGYGTIFKLTPNRDGSWTESVLHSFNNDGKDGNYPDAALLLDTAGNVYGTTDGGGRYDYGTVFELTPRRKGNWAESVLHSFNYDGKDGRDPDGLIVDATGNLYGVTLNGGADDYGTVFRLKLTVRGGWEETVLHSFRNHPGARPWGENLISDMAGNLYGTTAGDGSTTFGSVFEITP